MVHPFTDQAVASLYGQQVPREDENYLDGLFQSALYGKDVVVWKSDNWDQGNNIFSDANSVIRRSVLLDYPFCREIIVSEDYEWASRVLRIGYELVYNPKASVVHSHGYSLVDLIPPEFRRRCVLQEHLRR